MGLHPSSDIVGFPLHGHASEPNSSGQQPGNARFWQYPFIAINEIVGLEDASSDPFKIIFHGLEESYSINTPDKVIRSQSPDARNGHRNAHSSRRKYFWSQEGYPQAENGTGFYNKKDVLKNVPRGHGQVERLTCPFFGPTTSKLNHVKGHVEAQHEDKYLDDPSVSEIVQRVNRGIPGRPKRKKTANVVKPPFLFDIGQPSDHCAKYLGEISSTSSIPGRPERNILDPDDSTYASTSILKATGIVCSQEWTGQTTDLYIRKLCEMICGRLRAFLGSRAVPPGLKVRDLTGIVKSFAIKLALCSTKPRELELMRSIHQRAE